MKISTQITNQAQVSKLSGNMTFADNLDVKAFLDSLREARPKSCTLDMSELQHMDSAGLGLLILLKETSDSIGCSFEIVHPQGQVKNILELADFASEMTIKFD